MKSRLANVNGLKPSRVAADISRNVAQVSDHRTVVCLNHVDQSKRNAASLLDGNVVGLTISVAFRHLYRKVLAFA